MGMGVIIRDHNGDVVAAATKYLDACYDIHIVEALAFHWAIQTANNLLLLNVQVETDCKRLSMKWKSMFSSEYSYFVGILNDCADLLANNSSKDLVFVYRQANKATYRRASLAFLSKDFLLKDAELVLEANNNDIEHDRKTRIEPALVKKATKMMSVGRRFTR
ncbi:hypothetical protein JHK85_036451 [Glycine max]|nr:hypothetical protein JHK85_036451 [Glycine max]KAG4976382.1 hypothetical protein JHK86_035856 [Glycine max]